MRRQLRTNQSGFNLIEVSLAIAICSIGLIALLGLIPTGIDASRRAVDDTLATGIASDVLHWRRITPYTNTTFFPGGGGALSTLPHNNVVTMTLDAMGNTPNDEDLSVNEFYSGPYFLVIYSVVNHPQFINNPDIARLIVTVEWPNNAPAASRTRRTFISNYTRMQ